MFIISLIVFLPTLGALAIAFMPSKKDENGVNDKENQNLLLGATLTFGILTFLVTLGAFLFGEETAFNAEAEFMQNAFSADWIIKRNQTVSVLLALVECLICTVLDSRLS